MSIKLSKKDLVRISAKNSTYKDQIGIILNRKNRACLILLNEPTWFHITEISKCL